MDSSGVLTIMSTWGIWGRCSCIYINIPAFAPYRCTRSVGYLMARKKWNIVYKFYYRDYWRVNKLFNDHDLPEYRQYPVRQLLLHLRKINCIVALHDLVALPLERGNLVLLLLPLAHQGLDLDDGRACVELLLAGSPGCPQLLVPLDEAGKVCQVQAADVREDLLRVLLAQGELVCRDALLEPGQHLMDMEDGIVEEGGDRVAEVGKDQVLVLAEPAVFLQLMLNQADGLDEFLAVGCSLLLQLADLILHLLELPEFSALLESLEPREQLLVLCLELAEPLVQGADLRVQARLGSHALLERLHTALEQLDGGKVQLPGKRHDLCGELLHPLQGGCHRMRLIGKELLEDGVILLRGLVQGVQSRGKSPGKLEQAGIILRERQGIQELLDPLGIDLAVALHEDLVLLRDIRIAEPRLDQGCDAFPCPGDLPPHALLVGPELPADLLEKGSGPFLDAEMEEITGDSEPLRLLRSPEPLEEAEHRQDKGLAV